MNERQTVELALDSILSMDEDVFHTINRLSERAKVSWKLADRTAQIVTSLQSFCDAYELYVIESSNRKLVVLDLRIRMTKLPRAVADWFLASEFFKIDKLEYGTESVRSMFIDKKKKRTSLEEAIERVTIALQYRDEISILELSKRTLLTSRTVDRVIQLIQKVQEILHEFEFRRVAGELVKQRRRDFYELDESRMIYILEKRYLEKRETMPNSKEQVLMRMV